MTVSSRIDFSAVKAYVYKKETLLFLFAFGVRFALFIFLLWWFRISGHFPSIGYNYPISGGDSADYVTLTHNLFHFGTFSSSESFLLIPESFRLPGYSLFLYFFEFLPFHLLFAILAQIAVASGSVVLLYRFGKKFLSERMGFVAALLFSIEPTSVFTSVIIMSDTVFVFAMLLGIYLLFRRTLTRREALFTGLLAGIAFGYAVLVRVIAQYLTIFLLGAYIALFRKERRPFPVTWLTLSAFVLGVVLIVAPWSIRNYKQFGTFTISSTPYISFTQYSLVYFYAYKHHMNPSEVHVFSDPIPYPIDSLWYRSLINEPVFLQEIRDGLRGNLIPYTEFHLLKTLPFFLNDSLRDINRVTGFLPQPSEVTNFTDLLLHKDYSKILHYFMTPASDLWLLIVGSFAWVSITLLWLGGLVYAFVRRRPQFWFILVASGVIVYFAILSSPVIQPRYRMPAVPFMLLLAVYGAHLLWLYLKKCASIGSHERD